ncbi:MAG: ABC transporter ATP-binding protein [Saprospiraceae bacterium]|uniref:ABC transporter ATP-binding protein n=1 Tax=Candidatus Defluviibacterium haderslevense TaxID=2981993 RepID=A0A9D7SE07_9BACT|nr:ABC transporter ATP-binding protein [Candidatus Defluviibacterium haderslevense]
MNLLQVKDLSISFLQEGNRIDAVRHVNFEILKGETIGLVGESGSGKTVTAMSIMKLLSPNAQYLSGQILWLGEAKDFMLMSEPEIRPYRGAEVSIIFQEPMSALNPVLTCGYQLGEALLAHNKWNKGEIQSIAESWFTKVGLQDPTRIFRSYPHQLSGGQLQRVLIAIALCCHPKLVIADEPTTALDVSIQKLILDLLKKLKDEMDLTLLFISHDLGVVKSICDRVIVMQNGKIVEQNSSAQIFSNPQQPYTQGLINCRPPLKLKLKRLPTVQDFLDGKTKEFWFDQTKLIHSVDQDRHMDELHNQVPLLTVDQLSTRFVKSRTWLGKPKTWFEAVKKAQFEIYPGEVLGLVGESGSGKSSLGKSILGLLETHEGSVTYKEKNLLTLSPSDWRPLRKDLQIIFQDPYSALNPRKKIGSAIIEPMQVHQIHNNSKTRKEKAIEILEIVGLKADHYERYPHQFSGGQKQRICIARALTLSPKFIVCDESVSALDVSIQAQILNLFQDLKERFKLSYLFISHDFSVVNFMADRILVMKDGLIIEEGKSYEVINQPKTAYTQKLIEAIPK